MTVSASASTTASVSSDRRTAIVCPNSVLARKSAAAHAARSSGRTRGCAGIVVDGIDSTSIRRRHDLATPSGVSPPCDSRRLPVRRERRSGAGQARTATAHSRLRCTDRRTRPDTDTRTHPGHHRQTGNSVGIGKPWPDHRRASPSRTCRSTSATGIRRTSSPSPTSGTCTSCGFGEATACFRIPCRGSDQRDTTVSGNAQSR